MMYKQKTNESLDDFVNRCSLLAKKCDFTAGEVNERILEQIIASTPIQDFQRELLSKPKTYTLREALALGREFEATAASLKDIHQLAQPLDGAVASTPANQVLSVQSSKCS